MPSNQDIMDLLNEDDSKKDDTVEQLSDSEDSDLYAPARNPNGTFAKGGSPRGCRIGTPLKTTKQMKEWLLQFITDKSADMYEAFDQMAPKDKAAMYLTCVKFIMPDNKNTNGDVENNITITMKPAPKKEYPD